jgi:predicted ATPase
MRIHRVTINNFRRISEKTVDFVDDEGEPRTCTVLVGPNGSGKTTVLDAIHVAYAYVENIKKPTFRGGLDPGNEELRPEPQKPSRVEIVFSLHEAERQTLDELEQKLSGSPLKTEKAQTYRLAIEWPSPWGNFRIVESEPPEANFALRGRALAKLAKKQKLTTEEVFERVGGLLYLPQRRTLNDIAAPSLRTALPDELRERASEADVLPWLELQYRMHQLWDPQKQGQSLWSRAQDTFAELAAPRRMVDVKASDEGFFVRFSAGDTQYSHVAMSSGEEQMLRLAVNLAAFRAVRSVVLIDELEKHHHPRWQRNVLRLCNTGGGGGNQFIVTTHSDAVLRYVAPTQIVTLGDLH